MNLRQRQKAQKKWARTIRARRDAKGITQEELASASRYTLSYVQKIEVAAKGSTKAFDELIGVIENWPAEGRTV